MKQFRITSTHDVYEDHFETGEGKRINNWNTSRIINADTAIEALRTYYEKELYKTFDPERIVIDRDDIYDSVMVDEECCDASEKEIEMFMKNERKLWAENITINIYQLTPIELKF